MSVSKHVFGQLFKQKVKNIYIILVILVIGSIAISYFTKNSYTSFISFIEQIAINSLLMYIGVASVAVFAIYLFTCFQNEHNNLSQTWRLAPISDGQFYLANLFSSVLVMIYVIFLEIVVGLGLTVIANLISADLRTGTFKFFRETRNLLNSPSFWREFPHISDLLELLVIIFLLGVLGYLIVSFLNFSSRALLDFLPNMSGKRLSGVVRLVIIFLIAWLLSNIMRVFNLTNLNQTILYYQDHMLINILILLLLDLIFLACNLYLIEHYFEAKEK